MTPLPRPAWPALLALAALLLPPATAGPPPAVVDFYVPVDGELAHGLLAVPHGRPHALVVIAHGLGHSAESHRAHLAALADRGAVAVAMDYRGPRDGFPLAAGAADTVAATRALLQRYDVDTTLLFSVSMGTAVAGMALPALPGAFDWWVVPEGLANLVETYAEAKALAPAIPVAGQASAAIEAETGGTPATAPTAYLERTAVARVGEIRGLEGALLLHGANDGLVPYDQGRELVAALRAHGVPADFYTVLRGAPGGEGTTLTGYAGGTQVDGLAGHGSEADDAHTLTALSWDLTLRLLDGDADVLPRDRELVRDRQL